MMENPYLEHMVMDANPVRLVVMLYDKAISSLEEALDLMGAEDFDSKKIKYDAMGRALEIVNVLDSTLDMEKGGEIAKNLKGIYTFLMDEITSQMLEEDKSRLERIIGMLRGLKESWEDVEKTHYGKS